MSGLVNGVLSGVLTAVCGYCTYQEYENIKRVRRGEEPIPTVRPELNPAALSSKKWVKLCLLTLSTAGLAVATYVCGRSTFLFAKALWWKTETSRTLDSVSATTFALATLNGFSLSVAASSSKEAIQLFSSIPKKWRAEKLWCALGAIALLSMIPGACSLGYLTFSYGKAALLQTGLPFIPTASLVLIVAAGIGHLILLGAPERLLKDQPLLHDR